MTFQIISFIINIVAATILGTSSLIFNLNTFLSKTFHLVAFIVKTSIVPAVMKSCFPDICTNHIVSYDLFLHYSQCFGSGFACILIDLALLDLLVRNADPDPGTRNFTKNGFIPT